MFAIKIGDEFLDLPESTQLTFDLDHPAFSENFEFKDYSFPLDIPAKGKNETTLKIPGDLQKLERVYEFDITIYLFDNPWKPGKLIIDRPGTQKHGAYLKCGISAWSILDKKLWEVDLGGDHIVGSVSQDVVDHANTLVDSLYPAADYCFPTLRNEVLYGDENDDWEYFINRYDRTSGSFIKNTLGAPPFNKDSLMPCPFYAALMQHVFKNEGYTLTGSWLTSDRAKRSALVPNAPLDIRNDITVRAQVSSLPFTFTLTPSATQRIAIDDDSTSPNKDPQNRWDTTLFEGDVTHAGYYLFRINTKINVSNIVGAMTCSFKIGIRTPSYEFTTIPVSFFLYDTETLNFERIVYLGPGLIGEKVSFEAYDLNNTGIGAPVPTSADFEMEYFNMEMRDLDQSSLIDYNPVINLQNHVPDVTVRDFLQACQTHFGIQFVPNDRTRTIEVKLKTASLTNSLSIDLTLISDPDHEAEMISEAGIKSIGFEWPSDDDLLSDNFKDLDPANELPMTQDPLTTVTPSAEGLTILDYNTGIRYISRFNVSNVLEWQFWSDDFLIHSLDPLGSTEIRDKICPLVMRRYTTGVTGDVIVPAFNTPGYMPSFNTGTARTEGLRIVTYLGRNTTADEGYPLATSRSFGIVNGGQLCDTIMWTIATDGADLFHPIESWIKILNIKELWQKLIYLDANQLVQFITEYDVFNTVLLNEMRIIPKRLSFTVTARRIEPTRILFLVRP